VSGAIARIISFLPTAIASVLAARLILAHYGVPAFNGFTIAESLIVLVPLSDLGVGGAITAAFATDDPLAVRSQRVVLTSARVMTISALGLTAMALIMSAAGVWDSLLGHASYGGTFFGLLMIAYAFGFLPGLSVAMLLGVHRNHLTILVQTLIMPAVCLGIAALIFLKADGRWVVVLPGAAFAFVNLLTVVLATRITRFSWPAMLRRVPWRGRFPGVSIRAIAGPRLALSLLTPLALASDRVVLSHFSTSSQVADYGVVMQIFAPTTALIGAAAQPLWPIYLAARAKGEVGPQMIKVVAAFGAGTIVICGLLVPLCGPLGDVVGDGKVHLGLALPIAAAALSVITAIGYPMIMAFTTPKELRFAAWAVAALLPVNLVISSILAHHLGAPGPLVGTIIIGVMNVTMAVWYLRTRVWPHAREPSLEAQEEISEGLGWLS
jgi:O-antigen/teichoic acid export membrane protein